MMGSQSGDARDLRRLEVLLQDQMRDRPVAVTALQEDGSSTLFEGLAQVLAAVGAETTECAEEISGPNLTGIEAGTQELGVEALLQALRLEWNAMRGEQVEQLRDSHLSRAAA